ncbi:MAG: hypothetical protein KDJ19_00315 [Hyphomicrobiaceae bacterium]|nr:hypothetical protein [Hyphomicrobiaceae bacterium]MCC0023427.1 hypothetical protein [Hyphomicrobiaceae bacterium]
MGKINADWHRDNPMPKNPTPQQRIDWHLAHAVHCQCRGIPKGVLKLMAERNIPVPDGYDMSRK